MFITISKSNVQGAMHVLCSLQMVSYFSLNTTSIYIPPIKKLNFKKQFLKKKCIYNKQIIDLQSFRPKLAGRKSPLPSRQFLYLYICGQLFVIT